MTSGDWESWGAQTPAEDFVDRVMAAIEHHGHSISSSSAGAAPDEAPGIGRRTSRARTTLLLAAAIVVGSVAVFAAISQRSPRDGHVVPSAVPANPPSGPSLSVSSTHAPRPPDGSNEEGARRATILDRTLRNELRSRLPAHLLPNEAEPPRYDPHTGFRLPAGARGPSRNLTKEYIQQRVLQDFIPLARSCYEAALAEKPDLRGKLVIDFMIVGDTEIGGIVEQAKFNHASDIHDPGFETCMRESMLSMVFSPPENDGWVTVTYPIEFSPEEEDSGAQAPHR